MKTIAIDGYFFNREKLGGISRMWIELVRNTLNITDDIKYLLSIYSNNENTFLDSMFEKLTEEQKQRLKVISEKEVSANYRRFIGEFGPIRALYNRKMLQNHKTKVDLFHSSYMSYPFSFKRNIPIVVTVHDLILQKFKSIIVNSFKSNIYYYHQLATENLAIKNADCLIAVSQSTKNDLVNYFGFNEDRISVIHHGIAEFWFDDKNISKKINKPYFLFVGGRNPYKNYDTLLNALSIIKERNLDTNLIIVGENCRTQKKEQKEYEELNISDMVEDLGVVSDIKLKELYSNAIALIFPSIYEGFGFPLLESLACGCPVIASDIPTNYELGKSFIRYFPTMDANALSEEMLYLYNNPVSKIEKESYKTYAKTYTWESSAGKLVKIYNSLI